MTERLTNSRHKEGDIVYLSSQSKWSTHFGNPRGSTGLIALNSRSTLVGVQWSSGDYNYYLPHDSDLLTPAEYEDEKALHLNTTPGAIEGVFPQSGVYSEGKKWRVPVEGLFKCEVESIAEQVFEKSPHGVIGWICQ